MNLVLPTKEDEANLALDNMIGEAESVRNVHQIQWFVTDLFLQGVRNFDLLDYETGGVEYFREDDYDDDYEDGIPFRWEDAQSRIQTEIGRLSRLDVDPDIKKRRHSLDSLRNGALSQAVLDHMLLGADRRGLDKGLLIHTVLYGTAGLGHWREEIPDLVFGYEWGLVPAWELLGLPARSNNPADQRAVVRSRLVPLTQLEKHEQFKMPKADRMGELEIHELPYGSGPLLEASSTGGVTSSGSYESLFRANSGRTGGALETKGQAEKFVMVREVFVPGPKMTLARYLIRAGRYLGYDSETDKARPYRGKKVPFPLGIARYLDLGHFYGSSFAWKVIPFSLRLERLLRQLIINAEDMDRFGFLCIPNHLGISRETLVNTSPGPKVLFYERDLSAERDPIQQISPVNSSDIPGRVAQFMTDQVDKMTAQGPLFGGMAPGRADSGEAFQTLAETGSTHLVPTANSIQDCYTMVYRSMLFQAREDLSTVAGKQLGAKGLQLDVTRLTNNLAGLKIDQETGRVMLTPDSIPDPWDVDIGIRSANPVEGERRRQEGLAMLDRGLLTPLGFTLLNYEEDWGYPLGQKSVWENYIKAILFNLILFNDGVNPGQVEHNQYIDKPHVQALAIEDFITTAAFALASSEVQNEFIKRYNDMKAMMGALPQGASPPDQAAMSQELKTQAQVQGAKQQGQRPGQGPQGPPGPPQGGGGQGPLP